MRVSSLLIFLFTAYNSSAADTDVNVGDRFLISRHNYRVGRNNYREATVVEIEPNGKVVLRFHDNNNIVRRWNKSDLARPSGCSMDVCVGQTFRNSSRSQRKVTVVAIESEGGLVLRFHDNDEISGRWTQDNLTRLKGCVGFVCIGDQFYNPRSRNRKITVIGIEADGGLVVQFHDNNLLESGLRYSDLVAIPNQSENEAVSD